MEWAGVSHSGRTLVEQAQDLALVTVPQENIQTNE